MVSGGGETVVDLFGETRFVRAGRKGRPPFEWTEQNSHKVSMLLAMGWSNDRIAACILDPRTGEPISTATLKRYFRAELAPRASARDRLTARQMMLLWAQAEKGSVQAMKAFEGLLRRNDTMMAAERVANPKAEEARPAERLGKKEAAQRAAEEAAAGQTDGWGGLLKPGVVN